MIRLRSVKYSKTDGVATFDVDAQKGFTPVCPELPIDGGDQIVAELNNQFAVAGKFRLGSKDAHPKDALWTRYLPGTVLKDTNPPTPNVDRAWPEHCVVGTRGYELLDGLPPEASYSFFVWKGVQADMHPYGACYHDLEEKLSTGVIEWLIWHGVKVVIIGGLALDYCVKTTAIQLQASGQFKDVVVNLAACRGINKDSTYTIIDTLRKKKIVIINSINEIKC